MSLFNITGLKKIASQESTFKGNSLFKAVEDYFIELNKIIPDERVAYVFPIRLRIDKEKDFDANDILNLKLVVVTIDKNIVIISNEEMKYIKINFYDKADIKQITLKSSYAIKMISKTPNEYYAIITFNNGDSITLSKDDAKEELENEYIKIIPEIISFLTGSKRREEA